MLVFPKLCLINSFTAIILGFANSADPDETIHNQDLRCLTFSLSTLHINFFAIDSLKKKKKKKKKYSLKFCAKKVNVNI